MAAEREPITGKAPADITAPSTKTIMKKHLFFIIIPPLFSKYRSKRKKGQAFP